MDRKELGYVVCGLACVAILTGAILYDTPLRPLLGIGILVIIGWFIGVWRQDRAAARAQRSASRPARR